MAADFAKAYFNAAHVEQSIAMVNYFLLMKKLTKLM
jgi:hypothetical protein